MLFPPTCLLRSNSCLAQTLGLCCSTEAPIKSDEQPSSSMTIFLFFCTLFLPQVRATKLPKPPQSHTTTTKPCSKDLWQVTAQSTQHPCALPCFSQGDIQASKSPPPPWLSTQSPCSSLPGVLPVYSNPTASFFLRSTGKESPQSLIPSHLFSSRPSTTICQHFLYA